MPVKMPSLSTRGGIRRQSSWAQAHRVCSHMDTTRPRWPDTARRRRTGQAPEWCFFLRLEPKRAGLVRLQGHLRLCRKSVLSGARGPAYAGFNSGATRFGTTVSAETPTTTHEASNGQVTVQRPSPVMSCGLDAAGLVSQDRPR